MLLDLVEVEAVQFSGLFLLALPAHLPHSMVLVLEFAYQRMGKVGTFGIQCG